jgi:hypothetical protein
MAEWSATVSGHQLMMRDLRVEAIRLVHCDSAWSIYVEPKMMRFAFSGTDDDAKHYALSVTESALEHLLAQVRAMKEGTYEA